MFHGGDEDFVAGADLASAETGGDQIDPLGGAADKNDLARLGSVQKALDFDSGHFVFVGGPLTEVMDAAVNVGVLFAVESIQSVDDDLRFLSRGGIIQVDQRL